MRLTQKNEYFEYVLPCQNVVGDNQATEISLGETEYSCKKYIVGEAIKKLGELEDVLEEFELTSAEDLRNYLNFKGNMAIWEGKLELKNKIADLQHRLEVAEKALNEMSNYAINDNDLYDLVSDFNIENERYDEDQDHFGIDTCDVVDYFKEQAEKEVKGE